MELRDIAQAVSGHSAAVVERSARYLQPAERPAGYRRSEYAKMSNVEPGGTHLPVASNPRFPEASFKPSDGIRGL